MGRCSSNQNLPPLLGFWWYKLLSHLDLLKEKAGHIINRASSPLKTLTHRFCAGISIGICRLCCLDSLPVFENRHLAFFSVSDALNYVRFHNWTVMRTVKLRPPA